MNVHLYVIHGVRSAPYFLEGFREALHRRLESAGRRVRSETLLPYGDWSRSPALQLREVARDLFLADRDPRRSVGGLRVLERIRGAGTPDGGDGGRILLVAHSAGGVAAARAAELVAAEGGGEPPLVVMIGSPRFRISARLGGSVLSVCAGVPDRRGVLRSRDGISRIATFGGFASRGWRLSGRRGGPVRDARPSLCEEAYIPIAGGHTDYFRDRPPFVDGSGRTNLELTLETVWSWLLSKGV